MTRNFTLILGLKTDRTVLKGCVGLGTSDVETFWHLPLVIYSEAAWFSCKETHSRTATDNPSPAEPMVEDGWAPPCQGDGGLALGQCVGLKL